MPNPFDLFLSNWRGRRETLISPMSPDAVRQRLKDAIDSTFVIVGSRPARGVVFDDHARITPKPPVFRNAFQTVMTVRWQPSGAGARLDCRSSGAVVAQVFMVFWFAFTLIALAGFVWLPMRTDAVGLVVWCLPFVMMVFGVLMTATGRWVARNQHAELIAFLRQTLDAKAA